MGKGRKGDNRNPKKRAIEYVDEPDYNTMDDEIDAFHKQIDVVPLDINDDTRVSDEDYEHPVFDYKDDGDGDEEDNVDEIENDTQLTGLAAKTVRQQKYLRADVGGVEDGMHDDVEDQEEKRATWGRLKNIYYIADNNDYELQSGDKEAEALRLRKENVKSLSLQDFGLEDVIQDETDGEQTLEEILVEGKAAPKDSADRKAHDGPGSVYEEVKKDLNTLSKEEQIDVVNSSAPELVGLLSELNDALKELENKFNSLLNKEWGITLKGGMPYVETKLQLLLSYCQSITFYLLLKAEGQSVYNHPVIARLVEIKNLLDKLKQLDGNLPSELEYVLRKKNQTMLKSLREDVAQASDSLIDSNKHAVGKQEATASPCEEIQKLEVNSSRNNESKGKKRKHLSDHAGVQSMDMLKRRAALEEKLKQKGIFSSIASKRYKVQKLLQPLNRQLETMDDFNDDAMDLGKGNSRMSKGHATSMSPSKLSQLVTPHQLNKNKIISEDDNLPRRDDIGEKRRKHELLVLAGAGIESVDEVGVRPGTLGSDENNVREEGGESESDDEFYKLVKQQRASKLAARSKMCARTQELQSMPEETLLDGKRHITYQMENNRGLTRARKKQIKNPRKKLKLKHEKAVVNRRGQVPDMRKRAGPYSGEASGINAGISRSIRFSS